MLDSISVRENFEHVDRLIEHLDRKFAQWMFVGAKIDQMTGEARPTPMQTVQ